jgi:acetoin utilization deacetylase AcuC-like enzyme
MWHDPGSAGGPLPAGGWIEPGSHVESAETKRRFRNLVEASGLLGQLVRLEAGAAPVDAVQRVHGPDYVERIRKLSDAGGGDAGNMTPFGGGSYEIALLAAGGVIAAVDAVLDGRVENAYALIRPPGHHAEPDSGGGFCIFNNVAIAAAHAREARGIERVAVVDWDVHHGNGTQKAFYKDPSVLTISLHQDGNFPPGSGPLAENGEGAGAGANINVPLPAGSGQGAYVAALERVVLPALRRHAPGVVIVACGFDASGMDPLGQMLLHSESYRRLTELILAGAAQVCGGRVVFAHEGGYSPFIVPFCGLATVETLAGIRTEVVDPYLPVLVAMPGQELLPHHEAVVTRAAALIERVPAAEKGVVG